MRYDNVVGFYAHWKQEKRMKTPKDIEGAYGKLQHLRDTGPRGWENNGVCRDSYVKGCSEK